MKTKQGEDYKIISYEPIVVEFTESKNRQVITDRMLKLNNFFDKNKRLKEKVKARSKNKKDIEVLQAIPQNLSIRKILSVDFSTTSTGYAIYSNKKIITGLIVPGKSDNFRKRCLGIANNIESLIMIHNIDLLILEDTYTGANANVAEMLNEGRGYITKECIKRGIDILTVAPNFWKKNIEGMPTKGRNEQKEKSMEEFLKDLKKKAQADDEADAYCMLKGVFKAYEKNKKL